MWEGCSPPQPQWDVQKNTIKTPIFANSSTIENWRVPHRFLEKAKFFRLNRNTKRCIFLFRWEVVKAPLMVGLNVYYGRVKFILKISYWTVNVGSCVLSSWAKSGQKVTFVTKTVQLPLQGKIHPNHVMKNWKTKW